MSTNYMMLSLFSSSSSEPLKPYLSTLSPAELESLGLKAVSAGANPQKLQQAFATAQIKGDWTKLEKEIASVLGIGAINRPEVGLAAGLNSASSAVTNLINTQLNSQTSQTSSGESPGILGQASSIITKIQKVVNPPPIELRPDGTPMNPAEAIRNQNILTRFATEFGLTQEMLQMQNGINKVILSVNQFLGNIYLLI